MKKQREMMVLRRSSRTGEHSEPNSIGTSRLLTRVPKWWHTRSNLELMPFEGVENSRRYSQPMRETNIRKDDIISLTVAGLFCSH